MQYVVSASSSYRILLCCAAPAETGLISWLEAGTSCTASVQSLVVPACAVDGRSAFRIDLQISTSAAGEPLQITVPTLPKLLQLASAFISAIH